MKTVHNHDSAELILADLGEMAGALTHEFNSLLNNLTLRLALLKKTPLQGAHDDLGAIEEQVSHLTAVARDFQQRRRRESFELTAVDLNAVLLEAALLMQNHGVLFGTPPFMVVNGTQPANQVGAGMVIVERLAGLAPIMAYHGDLRRLCRFLLANALGQRAQWGRSPCADTATCQKSATDLKMPQYPECQPTFDADFPAPPAARACPVWNWPACRTIVVACKANSLLNPDQVEG